MNKKERIVSAILIIFAVILIIQLDVRDAFSHGYFTEAIEYDKIFEGDIQGYTDLSSGDYSVTFTPIKDHFAGFVLYFANQPVGNTGIIELKVYDEDGNSVDTIAVDMSKVEGCDAYKVYANKALKKGKAYTAVISAKDCAAVPDMILIDQDYITEECRDNNLLLGYAYEESTFTSAEKLFLTILIVSILLILLSLLAKKKGKYRHAYSIGIFAFLAVVMAWNYNFNSFDEQNTSFANFDKYSECLVTTTIKADQEGMQECIQTGLINYSDVTGDWNAYDKSFLTDTDWTEGYNNTEPQIVLRNSRFVTDMAVVGNGVLFENGDQYLITEVSVNSKWTIVTLNSERPLNWWKHGDLSNIRFIDAGGNLLTKGYSVNYVSQYGLQGKVFKHLARIFEVDFLNALTALAAAITLLLIVYLIDQKYNILFAGIFYTVFLLGPWVVNFANNLYWVEFTWFLPMAAGLLCAWKIDNRKVRIFSYAAVYISIAIKSLCGYEYMSVIMMGTISFMLVDLIVAFVNKDKRRSALLLGTITIVGVVALAGFFTAICIHAPGTPGADGSILKGMKLIFENDVMRRTYGADINNFDTLTGVEGYAGLASIWEVFRIYFHFGTQIITGIDGNLFPLVCIVPILIFLCDAKKKKLNIEFVALYCVSFVTSVTWFVLAKSHSYVHTHLNYVLWYFGYIQVCFYIILYKLIGVFNNIQKDGNQ